MTARGAIVVVNPATTPVTPTVNVFNYAYLDGSYTYLGTLNGIIDEPVFVGKINAGVGALQLNIDHYPKELSFGNLIRVTYPSGQVAGYWKFEGKKSVMAAKNGYGLTLTPLSSELRLVSFNANYSTDTTQPTAALGAVGFDVPVKAAIARTQHLSASNISNDGNTYSYVFNNSTGQDTLNQSLVFAGSSWWWYCDAAGKVSLQNTSPYVHEWTIGKDVSAGEWDDDIISLYNGQPVIGGTGPDGVTSLSALAQDTNALNPYSVPNIGERTNQPYQDTSLVDQGSVNTVASSLLSYAERVTSTRKLTITNYNPTANPLFRRPQPGDACLLNEPDPASSDPTQTGNLVTQGPYLLTDVSEYGGTYKYVVTVSASMVVPVVSFNPQMTEQQALLKLIQNPQIQPVSNNGTVGSIGNGVVGGAASSGPQNATPSQPVGLADTTGIDNLAQLNNAYVSLSWSANPGADVVVAYPVRYRKATDPNSTASYYQLTSTGAGIKIGSLFQGTSYIFEVAALNGAGVQSAWSVLSVTTALDTTPPVVPTNLAAYRTPRGAMVSWSPGVEAAGGTAPDLQGYSVQVAIDGTGLGWQQVTPNGAYALNPSLTFVAPTGTLEGTILYFRVAAVDWSGNLSAYTNQTPAIYTDGVSFEELTVGQLNVFGLLTATGGLTTRASTQSGAGSGPGVDINASGITLYDGGVTDHGAGAGITGQLNATNGNAFFSGTVSASQIQGVAGGAGGTGARMWLDFEDNNPGVGPGLFVDDVANTNRVQVGQTSDSYVGYGVIVNDVSGTRIFDSMGLSQVMTLKNQNVGFSPTGLAYATSWTEFPTSETNFTLPRPTNVLIVCTGSFYGSGGTASYVITSLGLTFVGGGGSGDAVQTNGSGVASLSNQALFTLGAGSYTAAVYYLMQGGATTTANIVGGWLYVYAMGG